MGVRLRRMYQDPAFVAEAEACHARVVSADRSHRAVDVPLPALPAEVVADGPGATPQLSPADGDGPVPA